MKKILIGFPCIIAMFIIIYSWGNTVALIIGHASNSNTVNNICAYIAIATLFVALIFIAYILGEDILNSKKPNP